MYLINKIKDKFRGRFKIIKTEYDNDSSIYTIEDIDGEQFQFCISSNSAMHDIVLINELNYKIKYKREKKINSIID
jgi:hypothetical protein